MDYKTKLLYQSNYWYNDGLSKASIRDLSGAITSLKKSLQYNTGNIATRNLLGLIYYGRGDVVEALVEWILSKNFQSDENIASYYIKKVQEVPGELEMVNQAVKKYNQSLSFAQQNGEDLAIIQLKKAVSVHPSFMKAYQLLALLYIKTEQYASARQAIRAAQKLDTTDDITLRYMHELVQLRKEKTTRVKEKENKEQQTVTYNIGNETIIQPVSSVYKEHSGRHTIINILVGAAVGVAVMWFLVMPATNQSRQVEANKKIVRFSEQIATQKAQISALKKELESYRATSQETESVQATAASTQESYEIITSIAARYMSNDMSDAAMLEELLKVNPNSLGTQGRSQFDEITGTLYPRMCTSLYSTSQKNIEVANYDTGIENLEQIMKMDPGYDSGGAMLLLAQAYEQKGDQNNANTRYQKIIEAYAGTQAATAAQEALDAQSTGASTTTE